jgi:hypothetical protein
MHSQEFAESVEVTTHRTPLRFMRRLFFYITELKESYKNNA